MSILDKAVKSDGTFKVTSNVALSAGYQINKKSRKKLTNQANY
jgi:hypothetical protein